MWLPMMVMSRSFRGPASNPPSRTNWLFLFPPHCIANSIPQRPPSYEAVHRRLFCEMPARLVGVTEGLEEPVGHRTMLFSVQPDVPVEVILEIFQSAARFHVQLIHDALKDRRQKVFPTKRERRGDGTEVSAFDDVERPAHKLLGAFGNSRRSKGG